MRRMICLGLLAALALSNAGCLVGIATSRGVKTCGQCRQQVVAVSGEIYIVDVCKNRAVKINPEDAIEAETLTETEIVTTEAE